MVVNSIGQIIKQLPIQINSDVLKLDVSSLDSDFYFIIIKSPKKIETINFIKNKFKRANLKKQKLNKKMP